MKPFNLEDAKKGAKIVDRTGREVKYIGVAPPYGKATAERIVCIDLDGSVETYTMDGFFWAGKQPSSLDLFMDSGDFDFDRTVSGELPIYCAREEKKNIVYNPATQTWGFAFLPNSRAWDKDGNPLDGEAFLPLKNRP